MSSTTSSPLLSSPSLSYHAHSDHSRAASPSTAPSTPPPASTKYFVIPAPATPAVLGKLPLEPGTDRVLVACGRGKLTDALTRAEEVLGEQVAQCKTSWEVVTDGDIEYYATTMHQLGVGVDVASVEVDASEMTDAAVLNLASASDLRLVISLPCSSLTLHILERPSFLFPALSTTNPYTLPTLSEFAAVWRAWDAITLGMVPRALLHAQPIELRHRPLFYIGHLPTFNALLLTRQLRAPMVPPAAYARIFERGIDPDVDDPTKVHGHSEVPERDEDWPTLGEVLAFRDRVRALVERTLEEVERGERAGSKRLVRTLMNMHEHEAWHLETILYILLQSPATRPPPGFTAPPFAALAQQWAAVPPPTTPCAEISGPVVLGHDDQEPADFADSADAPIDAEHVLGWDNESPARTVDVRRARVEWRPISNAQFYAYWSEHKGEVDMPKSWVVEDGEVKVKTFYGPQPLAVAGTWPCLASYDQLLAFARAKGGRLPSEPELRLFLDRYNSGFAEGANTGFRSWHPTAPTAGLAAHEGRGSNGGVWEWTSTPFAGHDGFAATEIFPGYSSDFFDGKHMVVLGASFATIPRLGERRTLRNFYQRNYPYPWVAARVCYDV
ncbi:hypothetical protein PsYK624_156830 [Phanerochaete sordida]|uniref:Sulfatase-modifying factor enzyme-like domain-containing protein n=1 Tax=Phanerochaete sordida TaxID=48140 RepID=A0A9P3GRB9_9APHY|nr:hypothetical protein PsYK624_156830 [Phanerochaete sordida]